MALTAGAASPAPLKGHEAAFVSDRLVLEADAVSLPPQTAGGRALGAGMALISRSVTAAKGAAPDQFDAAPKVQSPTCVAFPVAPGSYRLTSPYGYRIHPIFGTYTMHTGTDFAAPLRTPIHSVADGTVVYTGAGRLGRSSELVIIEHRVEDTTFFSWYVHMYRDGVFVEPGQQVRAGEVIAEVGNNGNSTGPHLHLEIHTSDAGLGLGLQKTAGARRSTAALEPETASAATTPDAAQDPDETTGEATTEPGATPSDPSTTPAEDASEPPSQTPAPDPSAPPTEEPTEPATEAPTQTPPPDPGATPTEPATQTPAPGPSATPTEQPTTTATPTPSPTATPEPTEPPPATQDGDDDAPRDHTPFPTRAYGTTVEPVSFLASLGLTMVAPSTCFSPRAG